MIDEKTRITTAIIPLKQAWVCQECDTISNRQTCPHCLSEATHPVSEWIPSLANTPQEGASDAGKNSAQEN